MVSFYGLGNFMVMSGRIINIFREGDLRELDHHPFFALYGLHQNCHGTAGRVT